MIIPSLRTHRKARIEIIPLIDVIFFLLATFVMISLSMVKSRAIPVNLPVATSGQPQSQKEFTSITVTAAGEIYFNKTPVSLGELSESLKTLKSETADPKVFLSGDDSASLGQAIEVLDEIRKSGITKIAIETKVNPQQ